MSRGFKFFTTVFAVLLIYIMPVGGLGTGAYLPERKFRIESVFCENLKDDEDENCNNEDSFNDSENMNDITLIDSLLLNLFYNTKLLKDDENFVIY